MNRIHITRKAVLAFVLALFLGHLPLLLAADGADRYFELDFSWKYKGKPHTMEVKLPETTYEHYRSKRRDYKYGSYVLETAGNKIIPPLAKGLADKGKALGLNQFETAEFIINFVQSLKYLKETGEYPRYPVETLVDGGGDCEDTAILLAAILDELEYDCVLLSPPRHMAVGLVVDGYSGQHFTYEGKRYYYIETTGRNWDIGEIPTAYEGKTAVYEIWGVNGPRKALTYKGPSPASYEKGVLQVAFYRSHQGQSGDYEGKQAFQYRIQLEGDPTLLDRVKKVEYRRMHKSFAEYRDRTWLAKTHRGNNFRADWKGWGYTPITVKVTYKSGQTQLFLIENEPELAGI